MTWTSVKEKNPDEYGDYLGSTKARPCGWVFVYAPVGWICSDDYPVTHWQPLPSPPHNTVFKGDCEHSLLPGLKYGLMASDG